MVFWRKIVFYGVLTRILFPMGLRVFCAIFFGKKCARANFYAFCMSGSALATEGLQQVDELSTASTVSWPESFDENGSY